MRKLRFVDAGMVPVGAISCQLVLAEQLNGKSVQSVPLVEHSALISSLSALEIPSLRPKVMPIPL